MTAAVITLIVLFLVGIATDLPDYKRKQRVNKEDAALDELMYRYVKEKQNPAPDGHIEL